MTAIEKNTPETDSGGDRPKSLSRRRSKAKQSRMLDALRIWLEDDKDMFEKYVRVYRIVYSCDPDLDDISNEWEEDE